MSRHSTAAELMRRLRDCEPAYLEYILGALHTGEERKEDVHLALGQLRPLYQVRSTFNNARLIELAQGIANLGLIHRLSIHAMTRDSAERYIALLRVIWGAQHTLDDIPTLERNGETFYLVFISGERRFRAITWLTRNVCSECEKQGVKGSCFARHTQHFPNGTIPVQLTFNTAAIRAFDHQMMENNHEKPNSHEDALGFRAGFHLKKIRDPNLTIADYAESVGRSPQTVYKALAYTNFPIDIQEAVAEGKLAYAKAFVLMNFHAERQDDVVLRQCLAFAIERRSMSTKRLRAMLADELAKFKSGQLSIFGDSEQRRQEKEARRRALDGEITRDMNRAKEFLLHVINSLRRGEIGQEDSPFASFAVARAVLAMWELLVIVTPKLLHYLPRRERQRIEEIRTDIDPAMAEIADLVRQSASAK